MMGCSRESANYYIHGNGIEKRIVKLINQNPSARIKFPLVTVSSKLHILGNYIDGKNKWLEWVATTCP